MRLVMLVPRRADNGWRDELWRYCRRWWEAAGFEIIEGHHDEGGWFNRSVALNRAARDAGDWDAAFLCDSDLICHPETVRKAAVRAVNEHRLVYPFNAYLYVNEFGTKDIVKGGRGFSRSYWKRWVQFRVSGQDGFALAVPVISRELWDRIGGMDERFTGWAPEDHAMYIAATTLGGPALRLDGGLWHLWHPTHDRPAEDSDVAAHNYRIFAQYQEAAGDVPAMRRLIATRYEQ